MRYRYFVFTNISRQLLFEPKIKAEIYNHILAIYRSSNALIDIALVLPPFDRIIQAICGNHKASIALINGINEDGWGRTNWFDIEEILSRRRGFLCEICPTNLYSYIN